MSVSLFMSDKSKSKMTARPLSVGCLIFEPPIVASLFGGSSHSAVSLAVPTDCVDPLDAHVAQQQYRIVCSQPRPIVAGPKLVSRLPR